MPKKSRFFLRTSDGDAKLPLAVGLDAQWRIGEVSDDVSDFGIIQIGSLRLAGGRNLDVLRKKLQRAHALPADSAQEVESIRAFSPNFFRNLATNLVIVPQEIVELARDFCTRIAVFAQREGARDRYGSLIISEPLSIVSKGNGTTRARDIALSLADLRAIWARANRPDEPAGPLLRAYLLFGGQRFEQLRRATVADIADERLTLWDSKGKRTQPRRHVVPILPEAQGAIDEMRGAKLGPFLVTLTHGESGADRSKVGKMVKSMARRMVDAGEISEPFTLGALRSTVETQLAAAGVQSDTLAQLQSHGLSGVQWRHYNRHDYHAEKRAALKKPRDLLTQAPATVTKLNRKRKSVDRRPLIRVRLESKLLLNISCTKSSRPAALIGLCVIFNI